MLTEIMTACYNYYYTLMMMDYDVSTCEWEMMFRARETDVYVLAFSSMSASDAPKFMGIHVS